MSKTVCNFVTPAIENLAKAIGRTPALTNIMVSAWQTKNQASEYPTVEQLKAYLGTRHPVLNKDLVRVNHSDDFARLMRDFTPFTLHDRATALARSFSDVINREIENRIAQTEDAITEEQSKQNPNKDELERLYAQKSEYNSPQARWAVIRDITVKNIFDQIREEYESFLDMSEAELDDLYGKGRGAYLLQEYAKILNNFPALLAEACILLENTEHLRIITEYHTDANSKEVFDGSIRQSSEDVESEENQFSDDEGGSRATGNDGWSFQVRFIDPYTTLSKGVKEVLSSIIRVDTNGNPDFDDLGNQRYLNPEYTHVALLNCMSSIVDSDDFCVKNDDGSYSFPALERAQARYPWVSQVISRLQSDPTLVGSFYADLRKDFIPYWHQFTNEQGILVTHALNQNTAMESMFNAAQANYEERQLLDEDSLYTKSGIIDAPKAAIGDRLVADTLALTRDFDEDDIDTIKNNVSKMLKMLGFDVAPNTVGNLLQSTDGIQAVERIANEARNIFQGVTDIDPNSNLFELFGDSYRTISELIGIVGELDNIASFRQGDKTRYSYSTPNYIDSMIKMIKDDSKRAGYLESEFGQFEWFKKNGRWRSGLLALLESDEDVRFHLATKELIDINGVEYSNWKPGNIREAFINEYVSQGISSGSQKQFAWYNMPIFSDSPVVKFIRLPRYTGEFKAKITPLLRDVVKQELWRIDLVQKRRANGAPQIQNFDKNGDKFHFFPELNNTSFLAEAQALIEKKDGAALSALIDRNITQVMDRLFADFMQYNRDIHAQNLISQGVIQDASQEEAFLEEYFWNQAYATTQIIELTTTDLAFYKDDIDFQKRYKEVYASGTKLNTNTTYGKKIRRTVYLTDSIITSTAFSSIHKALDEAVRLGYIQNFDRDNILDKFKNINVADAQAYVSPQSMRSILDMMGAWIPEMQASLERFESGQWDISDFNTLWQTIKPFVYTQLAKPSGLNDGKKIKVPHQNKNSEYLLLAAYNVVANSLGASPQLRALQRFMSENDIDVIQFQSAVKAGGQGIVNINYSPEKLEKLLSESKLPLEHPIFRDLKEYLDNALTQGKITQEKYNSIMESLTPSEQETYEILEQATKEGDKFKPEAIHEIPYRDYVIQQPTPEHLIDAKGVFGSQLRNLIIADISEDFKITINGLELDKKGLVNLYQSLVVENLLENYRKLTQRFQDIHSLQEALMDQVKGNVKYSRDMVNALQIVKVVNPFTGVEEEVFNMPLNNPSVTLKLQELVNSMFKNSITKQYIKGGNAILVSNFGLTRELNVIFNEEDNKESGIKGIECYLPASSRQFYEPFMKTSADGSYQYLDINKMPQELRKLIGYRIPTEDKYSMAPLIVKGFLPQQNGSAIMLPADITQIAGSDFDIDKMFLMIPEFTVSYYDYRRAREDYKKIIGDEPTIKLISALFKDNENLAASLEEAPNDFKEWFKENKDKYKYDTPKVRKVKYDITKSPQENTRAQRNNMLIDIITGVLTHPATTHKILNPGNFDTIKLQARITKIITDPSMYEAFCHEFGISNKEEAIKKLLSASKRGDLSTLNKFLDKYRKVKSQLTLETFVYNHVQNMTGAALIGMYANNTTAQAKYQYSSLALKDEYAFFINGRKIQSLHDVTSGLGERISRNCAQFSAASVDNVKDPVLADLLQNVNTARITAFMLRAGMSIEEISLLFAQPIVRECISDTGSLDKLEDYINMYSNQLMLNGGGAPYTGPLDFSSENLMDSVLSWYNQDKNITQEDHNKIVALNVSTAAVMNHIVKLSSYLAELTQISRADSPNGAILNNIAGAKVQVAKVDRYNYMSRSKAFPFVGVSDAIQNGIGNENTDVESLRKLFNRRDMPILQAFYSLGIEFGTKIMGRYFQQVNPYSDAMLSTILESAPSNFLSNMNQAKATRAVGSFYKDLVTFALSSTKTFGDDPSQTFEEKRDYYLNEYPQEFLAQKARNPEIAKLGLFKKLTLDKNGRIVLLRSGRMRQQARDSFMRDMDALRYMDGEAQQMAKDLFMYAYYSEGFWFGPNSFGNFFSTNFFNDFPEVMETMRYMKENMKEGSFYDKFMAQYYANHYNDGIVPTVANSKNDAPKDVILEKDSLIFVPVSKSFNTTSQKGEYPYVIYEGQLYQRTLEATLGGRTTYAPTTMFNNPKYNANMTAEEMKPFDGEKQQTSDEQFLNSLGESNDLSQVEQAQTDNDFSSLEQGMTQDMDSYLAMLEQATEESGEETLEQPLCEK